MKKTFRNSKYFKEKSAVPVQRIFLCLFFLTGSLCCAHAQLGKFIQQEIRDEDPKFLIRLDTRNSFIANAPVRIRGLQVGATFGEVLQVGIGFHTNRWAREIPQSKFSGDNVLLDYVALFMEYRFYERGKWFASYPMQIGFGDIFTVNNEKNAINHNLLIPYEALMVLNYKPVKYFSGGLGLGYRFLLAGNRTEGLNYNSPIYTLKFNLYFNEIISSVSNGRY